MTVFADHRTDANGEVMKFLNTPMCYTGTTSISLLHLFFSCVHQPRNDP